MSEGSGPDDHRVLVVDEYPIARLGFVIAIDETDGFTVVGHVETIESGMRLTDSTPIDLLLLGVHQSGGDDLAGLELMLSQYPDLAVVLLASFDTPSYFDAGTAFGAHVLIDRGCTPETLRRAIRAATAGEAFTDPSISASRSNEDADELTETEHRVLELVCTGLTNQQIASELQVTEHTVKFHCTSIYKKLDVAGRTEAVASALRSGLVRTSVV